MVGADVVYPMLMVFRGRWMFPRALATRGIGISTRSYESSQRLDGGYDSGSLPGPWDLPGCRSQTGSARTINRQTDRFDRDPMRAGDRGRMAGSLARDGAGVVDRAGDWAVAANRYRFAGAVRDCDADGADVSTCAVATASRVGSSGSIHAAAAARSGRVDGRRPVVILGWAGLVALIRPVGSETPASRQPPPRKYCDVPGSQLTEQRFLLIGKRRNRNRSS